jgi:Mrp family chromosome partitioning ATPase
MAEEDAAMPNTRTVDDRTIPPDQARPVDFPQTAGPGEMSLGRSKEPLLRLWRRMLRRHWWRSMLVWLLISGSVISLKYHPLDLSWIDFSFLVPAAIMTVVAISIWVTCHLIEVRSERVSDPTVLSDRTQSQVYALPVVPTDSMRRADGVRYENLIEQFVNRLDHLRFAIRGNSKAQGKGRCLLVASAVREEGRSTVAAQLAARCDHAGTCTLLIDADFHTSILSQLFDVPEGPGLIEVLAADAELDDVLMAVQGSTLNLLRAGEPLRDPVRPFPDPNIGMLIARCRERFDLTIIDCAPVVPSPDGLNFCEWVDGVLLVARYDFSRYPDIEGTRRKLAATGVPIIAVALVAYPFDHPPVVTRVSPANTLSSDW